MVEKPVIQCPLCGNAVPVGVPKCPVCKTDLSNLKVQEPVKGPVKRHPHDFLKRDIPKVVIPESKHKCPLCALNLTGKEAKCPRCGVPLSIPRVEGLLECPHCGFQAPINSTSCPKCGLLFEEIPGPPPAEELPPPPPEPPQPEPIPIKPHVPAPVPSEVMTASPPTPSPTPQGPASGRGAINGTGLVNGTGMINGTKGETRSQTSKRQRLFITRWQFIAVLVALVIVIPTFVYLSYSNKPRMVAIDGNFEDWSNADKFGVFIQATSTPIAISEWSVQTEGSRLFIYLDSLGDIMGSTDVSSYYLFVDSDNSSLTGYIVSGIGADYLLQLDGWNGSVQSTTLSEYSSTIDSYDWNSWKSIGALSTASKGSQLEAMADMPLSLQSSSRYMLVTQNSFEQRSVSYTVPEKGGLLIVEMDVGAGVQLGGLIDGSTSVSLMKLYLTAEGTGGTITSINPTISGGTLVSSIHDLTLEAGAELAVDILVDTSSAPAGTLVAGYVNPFSVRSSFADLQIVGDPVKAYAISAPPEITIDGAFADWEGKTSADSDSFMNPNENIDIDSVGAVNGSDSSAFYVSVVGEMCGGSFVPVIKEKPTGGGGGIVIPSRKTGEDLLRIYIDSDRSVSTGQVVTMSSKMIGADYMIEVTGVDGEIVDQSLMEYYSGQWAMSFAPVNAANDLQQLEVNVSSSSIGGSASLDFIVETTDWRQRTDLATAVPIGARSLMGGLPTGASTLSWSIQSSVTSPSATAMSYQRKLFYDGVNFWSFYFDGTTTVYAYSLNGGLAWTPVGPAFSGSSINEASIWYDSTSKTVYLVGDSAFASSTVHVRRGVVSPAAHTITWSATDSTPSVSTIVTGSKDTYISKDRSGYLWILSTNCTGTTPTRYDLSAFVTRQPDNVTSWRFSGNMLVGSNINQPDSKGSIVNIGTGSVMLAVYGYRGNVASRVLTTSWSAETIIYAIGTANPENTNNAPPCVVVDGSGVAHVVYGNGHDQTMVSLPFIYYVKFDGSTWSIPRRLDTAKNNEGNFYPTISLDSSTGNIYAFWISTTGGVGLTIEGKKSISGTWTSLTLSSDTTSPKQYLNSIYSAPSENAICWQWTQNTTGTIEVEFDKLPEFSDLAYPVLGLVAVVVIIHRKRTPGRKNPVSD